MCSGQHRRPSAASNNGGKYRTAHGFLCANTSRTVLTLDPSPKRGGDRHFDGGFGFLVQPSPLSSQRGFRSPVGSALGRKQIEFLVTKVVPPRCPGLIERPRLAAQLPAKRLGVIKAPAGFGKTSLAVAWVQRLRQSRNAVAWLTIDADDNETHCFLFYVAQALHHTCKGVGADAINLIQESFLISPHTIVSSLINDLADVEDEIYLFLEDYHWVTSPEIHEAMALFLKHAPSHCHVVLTTRAEPPFPLASLRAQNQLPEIDASSLRFDLQETQHFLEIVKPGTLALSDISLLHEKTEGWPAALRIVLCTSAQSDRDIGWYARKLSGTDRSISAYLAELLRGLPHETVLFMLRTAILGRLSAPVCDAVTETVTSQETLASIEKRQLLLAPLDEEGQWYRYHALLADYLIQKLKSERSHELPTLHRRASLWYASQELWTDAVQHAIAAGDADQALGWIKNCAMTLVKRGDLFTLLEWQRLFPIELMRSHPEVSLAIAWGLALAMRFDESLRLEAEIGRDIIDAKRPKDREALHCECQTIRSVAIALKDDTETALNLAKDCRDRSTDLWTANVASNVLRYGYLKAGNLKEFYAVPWIPYSIDEDRRNVFASVYRRCIQGMAEAQQLRIAVAEGHYSDALRLAEQYVGLNSVAAALPASLIAHIRYEQGRLEEAETLLIDREPLINAGTILDCVLSASLVMTRIATFRKNLERTHALLERADNLAKTRGWGRLHAAAALERTRLYIKEGRTGEAAACVNQLDRLAAEYPAPTNCARSDIHRYAALARAYVLSAEERVDDAVSLLIGVQHEFEAVHDLYSAARVGTQLATVRFGAGQTAEAVNSFRGVLMAFAQAGMYRPILDESAGVAPLLAASYENAKRTGDSQEHLSYIDNLIARSRPSTQSEAQRTPASRIEASLSAREGDILRLIGRGLSNKEIARNLTITPETVKSHVKNIFIKLSVEKRAQAVARAQSLGLVTTQS